MVKVFLIIVASFILSGCLTTPTPTWDYKQVFEFKNENGYIGLFASENFVFRLKNLDSNELLEFHAFNYEGLYVFSIPSGQYAIMSLDYYNNTKIYNMVVPLFMKTIIDIEENKFFFLGEVGIDIKEDFFLGDEIRLMYNYPVEQAFLDIKENYSYDEEFQMTQIEPMNMGNVKDQNEVLY